MYVASRIILAFLLLVALNPFNASAQSEEKDKTDAIKSAHQVTRYLQQSQDIRPVLRKYAVKNFFDGTNEDHLFNVFLFLDKDVVPKLDKKTKEDYYIAASNWLYFVIVYTCINKPKVNAYGGTEFVYPSGVEEFMRGKPILSNVLSGSDPTVSKPKTIEAVKKAVLDLKKVNSIYRPHLNSLKKKPYKQYLSIAEKSLGGGEVFFKPEVSKCENNAECVGLPRGSRFILMNIPGFYYVEFARVKGRMKIVHIYQGPGD